MRVIVAILFLCSPALADNCRVQNVRLSHINAVVVQDFAAVSFAVPIGVPVAQVTPAFYSYNATAQAYAPRQADVQTSDAKLFEEFLQWRAARVRAQGAPVSLFSQTCQKCHSSGGSGFAHHDFSKPLSDGDKLKAIKAVMTGKMPPKRVLEPQVRSDVIAELSGVNEVKAAVVPQQPQPPSENQK